MRIHFFHHLNFRSIKYALKCSSSIGKVSLELFLQFNSSRWVFNVHWSALYTRYCPWLHSLQCECEWDCFFFLVPSIFIFSLPGTWFSFNKKCSDLKIELAVNCHEQFSLNFSPQKCITIYATRETHTYICLKINLSKSSLSHLSMRYIFYELCHPSLFILCLFRAHMCLLYS